MQFPLSKISHPWRPGSGAVLHLGAGSCHELDDYLALGARRIVLVEADPELAESLRLRARSFPHVEVVGAAAAAADADAVDFRVLNNPRDSSLLEPERLTTRYPNLRVSRRISVPGISFDRLVERMETDPLREDLLVVELQGAELSVLGSAAATAVRSFAWIAVRACTDIFYEGGSSAEDLDAFLAQTGFMNVAPARTVPGLPFRESLYYFDKSTAHVRLLENLVDEARREARSLRYEKIRLEADVARLEIALRDLREMQNRQQGVLSQELAKAERQVELIRAILLRD